MRGGYWVVAIFATGWASAGLLATGYPPVSVLIPALMSGALLLWAYNTPATARPPAAHVRKLLARWSMIEGVAIVVAVNLLQRMHRPDATFSVVAIIVGLHFLPLARHIPVRLYYLTAAGLVAVGAAGLLIPASERPLVIGLSAATVLWATAIYRLVKPQPLISTEAAATVSA